MDYKIFSAIQERIEERWQDMARELGVPEQTIHMIHTNHQGNTKFCFKQMMEEYLIGREGKIDWHSFAEASRKLPMEDLVTKYSCKLLVKGYF